MRGQVQPVMDAFQRPELAKFASQPLDAAGASEDGEVMVMAVTLTNHGQWVDMANSHLDSGLHWSPMGFGLIVNACC